MCYSSSYDRLIDLAKQTGSKLIVHDPIEGRDVVLLSIDEFEKLNHNKIYGLDDCECDCGHDYNFDNYSSKHDRHDVRGMSERELLDQINRDIAIWRADKNMEERWEKEMLLEDEIDEEGPFDPFAEHDYHPADWHSAGDVLENKFHAPNWLEDEDDSLDFDSEEDEEGMEIPKEFFSKKDTDEIKVEDIPDFDFNYNDIGEESITGPQNIPYKKTEENTADWLEEPLGENEDPVFYEEPV
ncbi:MAG: hypothetical protein WA057_04815 [Candidatus Magasanikiibacteriota bacterium]